MFRGSTETKKTPKNALSGLGWHKHRWRVARQRQARLKVETRGRKVLHAPSRAGREVRAAGEETRVTENLPSVL